MKSDPIRIAIDARPLAGPPCGYSIYLGSILQCLRGGNFDVTLISNAAIISQYDDAVGLETRLFGSMRQLRWEQRDLPRYLASARHDLYFTGANRGIPLRKIQGTRTILGLLDVIPYLFFRDYHLRRWKTVLRDPSVLSETLAQLIAVGRADAILTISQQSARDIGRIFRRHDASAHLIRLKDVSYGSPVPPRAQFVYLGGIDPRKKVDVLLRGFAMFARNHPGHRLVLVGSSYSSLGPQIAQLGIGNDIVLTGHVDHDAKFEILRESIAMIYPSLYEGYGMAIAEAFQAGIPVVAGQGGSQEEIGGNGIRPIDPCSAEAIAAAMSEMLDPDVRAAWAVRGQDQLARLTAPEIETATIAYFAEQGRLARNPA